MSIAHIVTITGGRAYRNRRFLARMLYEADPDLIIHGGARGADTLADEWAKQNGIPRLIRSVSEREWRQFGGYAGHLRNAEMADIARQLIHPESGRRTCAGIALPGGNGTANMVEQMLKRGLVLYDHRDDPEAL